MHLARSWKRRYTMLGGNQIRSKLHGQDVEPTTGPWKPRKRARTNRPTYTHHGASSRDRRIKMQENKRTKQKIQDAWLVQTAQFACLYAEKNQHNMTRDMFKSQKSKLLKWIASRKLQSLLIHHKSIKLPWKSYQLGSEHASFLSAERCLHWRK